MNDWQPIIAENGKLELIFDNGLGHKAKTLVTCSEGDTLEINQTLPFYKLGLEEQYIMIDRHELYNIIFNFMSAEELVAIANKKVQARASYKSTGNADYRDDSETVEN